MASHMRPEGSWEYHQDGRDRAASLGAMGIAAIVILIILAIGAVVVRNAVDSVKAKALAEETRVGKGNGSAAGANAVTREDIVDIANTQRDEYAAGEWSVTTEDLEREYELGQAYPQNGKNAALDADTTYNRGAGMVDLVTYDRATNVEIRHYGQLQADGTVRWYAAETVLGADGKPVVMPTS